MQFYSGNQKLYFLLILWYKIVGDFYRKNTLCVTNDTLVDVCGTVEWQLCDNGSNILQSGRREICVEKLSVKRMEKLDFSEIDAENAHLSYAFIVNGEKVSCGSVLFTQPKYYNFINPNLKCRIEKDEIVITSQGYVKGVEIDDVENDLILDDNYFDMEKGEKRIKILSGNPTKLIIRSVYDIR